MVTIRSFGLVLALVFATAKAHAMEEPFEPDDDLEVESLLERPPRYRPVTETLLALVSLYREEIGPRSVSRCPFVVSCSTLAKEELEEKGILGLFVFMDRYFYRENIGARRHYPLRPSNDGRLLLDDQGP